jgi:hypothetical protein
MIASLSVAGLIMVCLAAGCRTDPATGERSLAIFDTATNATGEVEYVVSPEVKSTAELLTGVNDLNPTPAAPIIELVTGGVVSLLGIIAAWKTGKSKGRKAPQRALEAVVKAIEAGPFSDELEARLLAIVQQGQDVGKSAEDIIRQIRAIDWSAGIKTGVQSESIRAGAANTVHAAVVKVTKDDSR